MKLTFLGANHEVTGSCTLLEAAGQRYLIDCGMEQGKDVYENQPFPVAPGEIDGVLVTHAHIDHTGQLPLLVRNGFRGRIYATKPTAQLCSIMLRDSAHIQEFEAEWKNRKAKRAGAEPVEPMYTVQDAEAAMQLFRGMEYNTKIELAPGLVIRFIDVGHLLGSSSIEIWVTESGTTTKLVFSGDIGNQHQPIIKDPTTIRDADYVFMESTYGDRSHGPRPDYVGELSRILQRTFDRGGNVVIPSFAVGRTQELLYFIREIKKEGLVTGHGNFPVYIDSPLAIEATRIFKDTDPDCFDEDTRALLAQGIDPIQFPGLQVSVTSDESRMINADRVPKVIISASGMCEAGRIRHHLKHNLWRPECTILFVGYQAVGTLGRTLIDGAVNVKLFGETIDVQAEICQLTGLSGHADREGLLAWVNAFSPKPKRVFVIHGEDEVENIFAQTLTEQGFTACAPYNGEQWAIGAEGAVCLQEGSRVRLEHKPSEGASRAATVFQRLVSAGKRLLRVIEHNEGGANKDLAKFADQRPVRQVGQITIEPEKTARRSVSACCFWLKGKRLCREKRQSLFGVWRKVCGRRAWRALLVVREALGGSLVCSIRGEGAVQCFVPPVPDAEQRECNAGDKGADADHDISISAAVQQHRAVPGQNDGKTRNMLLIQQGRNADCQKQTNCGESAVDSMCPPLTKPACAAANFLHTNTRLLGHGQSLLLRDHQSGCFPSSLSPIIQFAPIPFTQI